MGGLISMVDFNEFFLCAVCVELILVATCSLVKKILQVFCTRCVFKTCLKSESGDCMFA